MSIQSNSFYENQSLQKQSDSIKINKQVEEFSRSENQNPNQSNEKQTHAITEVGKQNIDILEETKNRCVDKIKAIDSLPSVSRTESVQNERDKLLEQVNALAINKFEIKSGETEEAYAMYPQIATGKAKSVLKAMGREGFVFIQPLEERKMAELLEEIQTANIIKHNLSSEGVNLNDTNLAIEFEVLPQEDWVSGVYTVGMPEAKMDLEGMIKKKKCSFSENLEIISQVANGMKNLHQAGFVHGDLKPENVLIYKHNGKYSARIADFGKSQAITVNQSVRYSGNPRFCAPEGGLSFQSEVFGTALIMIRTLESEFLDESRMMLAESGNRVGRVSDQRRGVERFLVLSPNSPQEEVGTLLQKLQFYGKHGSKKNDQDMLIGPQKDIYSYIGYLIMELKNKYSDEQDIEKIDKLGLLLMDMTDVKPENRPSMARVAELIKELELPGDLLQKT